MAVVETMAEVVGIVEVAAEAVVEVEVIVEHEHKQTHTVTFVTPGIHVGTFTIGAVPAVVLLRH